MIKMKGLTHFTIPVTDLKRSKEFYIDTIGFDFVRENKHMVFCKNQDDYFVLTHSKNKVDPNPGDENDIHTAFYVDPDEYDRAKDYLAGKGVKIILDEERHGDATFTGRSLYFLDPDRNVIELHDSDKD
ncbi:MAG: VOC family protein [Rhodospirillales bacterium]|nr:VOC family protein [Rhodospirillales bacterium]